MTSDIAAFIRARLDDTASIASDVHHDDCEMFWERHWSHDGDIVECNCNYSARVLRGVEAKRRIVEEHVPADYTVYGDSVCRRCVWDVDEPGKDPLHHWVIYPCLTLRALATEWSDHLAYETGWAL